jgi:hypothetical protein
VNAPLIALLLRGSRRAMARTQRCFRRRLPRREVRRVETFAPQQRAEVRLAQAASFEQDAELLRAGPPGLLL